MVAEGNINVRTATTVTDLRDMPANLRSDTSCASILSDSLLQSDVAKPKNSD